jgi:hypothetical protein
MYSGWFFLKNFVAAGTGIFMDWPPDHSVQLNTVTAT